MKPLLIQQPLLLQQKTTFEKNDVFPFITIAVQTDMSIVSKSALEEKWSQAVERAQAAFYAVIGIPDYMLVPAINKLKNLISALHYNTHTKSIVVFLSPFVEKVYHLNFLITEKVSVGEPLRMRGLVSNKKEERNYLVLLLENEQSSIYHGEGELLKMITYNSVEHIKSPLGNTKDKFFLHVDNVLTHVLRTHHLPLIAIGNETALSDFKRVSRHTDDVTLCIHSHQVHFNAKNSCAVKELVKPVLDEWETHKENYLKTNLDKALFYKKAETGIADVYKAVKAKRGKLLIVERDFYYPVRLTDSNGVLNTSVVSSDGSLLISDAVEDIIERLASYGGKVEFVNSNVLHDYEHIALIM